MRPDCFLLSKDLYVEQLTVGALAAQSYPASGSYIDVGAYERVAFLLHVGTSGSETTLQLQQATSVSGSATLKDITGATLTVANTDDNLDFAIEVQSAELDIGNDFHYITCTVSGSPTGTTAALVFWGIRQVDLPATWGKLGEAVRVVG